MARTPATLVLTMFLAAAGQTDAWAEDRGAVLRIADALPTELLVAAQGRSPTASRRKKLLFRVGPKRKLRVPSQAAKLARDGDTILIDAGTYRDCAVWRANRLIIRGVGGLAHVKDISCEEKAIWVIHGHAVTVENIRFSGARVPNRNGAGIRFHGGLLIVRKSHFNNNQMGILTHNKRKSWLLVEGSTFQQNGDCASFCGHGIYAGRISGLRVVGSTFRFHKFGHHIKSRALKSEIIGNWIMDGPVGTASFSIDLPNGGTAIIRNNVIEKGARSDNRMAMISIGEEGVTNPSKGSIISNNFFTNANKKWTRFVWNRSRQPLQMLGNKFSGKGKKLVGGGVVIN